MANTPVMLPISTMLVDWFVLELLLVVVPDDGVCPVFCEPTSEVAPLVGVEIAAVATAVGDTCFVGVGSDAGRAVGEGDGVGVGVGV